MAQYNFGAPTALAAALLLIMTTAWVAAAARELVSSTTSVAQLMSQMKSPLSKSQATTYAELYKRTGSVGDLCQTGHLYCDAQAYNAHYEKVLQPAEQNVEEKDIAVFFRESELVVGHQVTIVDPQLQSTALERNRQALAASPRVSSSYIYFYGVKVPERAFLPTELAHALPISTQSAAQIFSLDESSTLAKESSNTVHVCKEVVHDDGATPLQGEAASCAFSLEELESLLRSPMLLGGPHDTSNLEALTTDSNLQGSFTGQVVDVNLKASEKSRHATCHNIMYPSAVYFCHYLPNTRIYAITLQQAPNKLLQSVAMCHLDTSSWNSGHLAFQNLRSLPGQGEACHWVLQSSVTFVPAV